MKVCVCLQFSISLVIFYANIDLLKFFFDFSNFFSSKTLIYCVRRKSKCEITDRKHAFKFCEHAFSFCEVAIQFRYVALKHCYTAHYKKRQNFAFFGAESKKF